MNIPPAAALRFMWIYPLGPTSLGLLRFYTDRRGVGPWDIPPPKSRPTCNNILATRLLGPQKQPKRA